MMNKTGLPAERLLKPWTAKGLVILRQQAKYVEVEVPYLAFDSDEVARAMTANFEYIKRPGWGKRAMAPGITADELYAINTKRDHDIAVARHDLTLAAAIMAHRACASPATVSRHALMDYLGRRFLRGGRGIVEPCPVEFLLLADNVVPTIFATESLTDVTRFVGRDFLSVRVSEEELQEHVKNALKSLEEGKPSMSPTLKNIQECFPESTIEHDRQGQYEE